VTGVAVRFPAGVRYFSRLQTVQHASGAYVASNSLCTVGPFLPGVKRLECEGNHVPPYSAEVENE
jgi:hypothetical protein